MTIDRQEDTRVISGEHMSSNGRRLLGVACSVGGIILNTIPDANEVIVAGSVGSELRGNASRVDDDSDVDMVVRMGIPISPDSLVSELQCLEHIRSKGFRTLPIVSGQSRAGAVDVTFVYPDRQMKDQDVLERDVKKNGVLIARRGQ